MTNLDDDNREIIPMRIVEEVGVNDTLTTYYDIIQKDGWYWWRHDGVVYGKWDDISDAINSAVDSLLDTDGL
jgi:hypothetical protein